MAQQRIIWTVLPNGRGRRRPAARVDRGVATPHARRQPSEQILKAFPEWRDWPATLDAGKVPPSRRRTGGRSHADQHSRIRTCGRGLFHDDTPVAGFVFKNMAQVNLRSYPVRNVLALVRQYYGKSRRAVVEHASNAAAVEERASRS